MNNVRNRAISVGSAFAFANLPKYHSSRRTHSTVTGIITRTLRVVVLGVGGVGKTAMTVRFVTKRFIGDYDPNLETIYRHTTLVDDQLVNFEVMDTAGQGDDSLSLEDKCKWGESFVFVYDVTDRHSFDELTRLKFIASYTHSRLRVNFTPCWVLIGNKADLADRERMVSLEEGRTLAQELNCHDFREISVKESTIESCEVFEDLWRQFYKLSPRSPSSGQRKKFSYRIQDKISIIDSSTCSCATETLKRLSSHPNESTVNEALVTTLTSTLKRQMVSGSLSGFNYRNAQQYLASEGHSIPNIPENIKEDDEDVVEEIPKPRPRYQRSRRNALVTENTLGTSRLNASSDNDLRKSVKLGVPDLLMHLTNSSRSSSNASLSSLSGSASTVITSGSKSEEIEKDRNFSDAPSLKQKDGKITEKSPFDFYPNRSRKNRTRSKKSNKTKFNQPFPHNLTATGFNKACQVIAGGC